MNRRLIILISLLVINRGFSAGSFSTTGTGDQVPLGTYDALYDDGRSVNTGVIYDRYGMESGISEGVIVDYEGSGIWNIVSGFYFRPNSGSALSSLGDLYANISMNYTLTASESTDVVGIYLRRSSQAEEKSVYIDRINVLSQGSSGTAYGIYNYESSLGDIMGTSESSVIRSEGNGNSCYGLYNILGGQMGNLSSLGISTQGGTWYTYGIYNQEGTVGNLSKVQVTAAGSYMVFGIYNEGGHFGKLEDVSINVSGGSYETIGLFLDSSGSSFGELSGLKIQANAEQDWAVGIYVGSYIGAATTLSFSNASEILAESSQGVVYAIRNDSSQTLTLQGIDESVHTFRGNLYSRGALILDGAFKLENGAIILGSSLSISGDSMLSWNGTLDISGGEVTVEDGATLSVYISDVAAANGEYLILQSEKAITVTAGSLNLELYDAEGQALEGYGLTYRPTGDAYALYAVAIPEPAGLAFFMAAASVLFIRLKRKRRLKQTGAFKL